MFLTLHPEKNKSILMMTGRVMKCDMNEALLRLDVLRDALAVKKDQCARNKSCVDVIKPV